MPTKRYKPWYEWLPFLTGSVMLLVIVTAVVLTGMNPSAGLPLLPWLLTLCLLILIAAGLWGTWIVPWLASADPRLPHHRLPRSTHRSHHVSLCWVIPGCIAGIGALLLTIEIVDVYQNPMRTWHWSPSNTAHVSLIVIGILVAIAHRPYSRLLHKRFTRTARQARICFHCGYDLRGNPTSETCPECGHSVQLPPNPAG